MLRLWQTECIEYALHKFEHIGSHFFCQATPGAGKTIMAANLAKQLLLNKDIDLILCISPSVTIAAGLRETFSKLLQCEFNGSLGSVGISITYQSLKYLGDSFLKSLSKHRVFVVFDEVHHCSGSDIDTANVWGQQILLKIQGLSTYTLALSGTPWRSDELPIVMAEYTDPDGEIICDYQYGLKQAIAEKVCRSPRIGLIDNDNLVVSEGIETKSFPSILEMLKATKMSYQHIIQNTEALTYILTLGCNKLAELRKYNSNAGGLIVAASIQHAIRVQKILNEQFNQTTTIVTYHHDSPLQEINSYRNSTCEWIVSVGMISEGTDIPRLQVCCHISAIKTELYFRQVLGRILRINNSANQEAWLYTFAEPNLVNFVERIEHDIPESCMFIKMKSEESFIKMTDCSSNNFFSNSLSLNDVPVDLTMGSQNKINSSTFNEIAPEDIKLGQFRQRVISAFS